MRKITVKHYLNKRLKSKSIYVRVIYNRKDTNFPSEIVTNMNPPQEVFDTDAKLKREMDYESEIITSIIEFCVEIHKDQFTLSQINIPSLINDWKHDLSSLFEDLYLTDKKTDRKIRNPLCEFIANKTKIDIETIDNFITNNIDFSVLCDLAFNHNIYDNEIKENITYCKLLSDFERFKYGEDRWIYGADNMLCYYEWSKKNMKEEFVKFALKKKSLSKELIKTKTAEFDIKLREHFESLLFFSPFTRGKREE